MTVVEVLEQASERAGETEGLKHTMEEILADTGEGRPEVQKDSGGTIFHQGCPLRFVLNVDHVCQHAALMQKAALMRGDPSIEDGLHLAPHCVSQNAHVCVDEHERAHILR